MTDKTETRFESHVKEQFVAALRSADTRIANEIGEEYSRRLTLFREEMEKAPANKAWDIWVVLVEELAPPRWMKE